MPTPESSSSREPVPVMADAGDARARRLVTERTELIGWLAGAVAHDVNNVLAAIAGYAELIEADLAPDDPHAADTEGIRDAVLRAGGLVRQLLMVGRRQTLRLEVLDAVDLVAGLVPLLSSACGDRVQLEVETSREPAGVLADRSLLEQALLNLAVNARDAMPDGGTLTLRVTTGPAAAPGPGLHVAGGPPDGNEAGHPADEVRLEVQDTGTGIDAAILPHVFEPYFTTKDATRGSGIGLAIVEEAAVRCGGRVTIESRVGVGTRFTLHLPRSAELPVTGSPGRLPERIRGGTESILVVDADPEVRLVLARVMRSLGYSVVDAATPLHALALVEHAPGRLDLLVTETALPGRPGGDLADRVRAVHPGIPVLYLSRAARGPSRPRAAAESNVRVLAKPFTAERLGSALRSLLDARQPEAVEG